MVNLTVKHRQSACLLLTSLLISSLASSSLWTVSLSLLQYSKNHAAASSAEQSATPSALPRANLLSTSRWCLISIFTLLCGETKGSHPPSFSATIEESCKGGCAGG